MTRVNHCVVCDAELPKNASGMCDTCRLEIDAVAPEPGVQLLPWAIGAPSYGVHVAGPVIDGVDQHCARCGELLACMRVHGADLLRPAPRRNIVPFTCYPEGALVERGRGWQAMTLNPDAVPTCGEPAEARS
jgi:hypothetical protein